MKALSSPLYFAYGSNMHPLRMAERVPTARPLGVGCVAGHVLRFHKRGQDGSGKCNAIRTGDAGDTIHGVVYAVSEKCKQLLDVAEGGYRADQVHVQIQGASRPCFTYLAEPGLLDESLRPFEWYKRYVLDGGIHHDLPEPYMQAVKNEQAISDPDAARQARHDLCLGTLEKPI